MAPDKENLSAKVIDKDTLSEETPRATQVLHTGGNSLHHHKKIGNTRHRCFVVLSGRNQTACDDQTLDRVMTAPRFGRGAKPRSSDHFTNVRKQTLEYARKADMRFQSWSRRLVREKIRTEHRLWFCGLPDSQPRSCYAPSTNASDEDEFHYGGFIGGAHQSLLDRDGTDHQWLSRQNQSWQGDGRHQQLLGGGDEGGQPSEAERMLLLR